MDNSCDFDFDYVGFSVKDHPTQMLLTRCNSWGSLYPFLCRDATSISPNAMVVSKVSPYLWHQHLAHPRVPIFYHFYKQHSYLFCPNKIHSSYRACELGKHSKLSFFTSVNVSQGSFQLVHYVVWKFPISSFSGYQYYVSFIADFIGYCWVYAMKLKSEV